MLKITAEEVNFIIYQYLHETGKPRPPYYIGFQHSSFVFAQEANMHENKYNNYRIPAGLLITFLEKALLLIHMETHLNDVSLSGIADALILTDLKDGVLNLNARFCRATISKFVSSRSRS